MRFHPILVALASVGLSGCATDVVLKPAVAGFVADGRQSTAAVARSYVELAADANRATAMLVAAHPECGLNTSILVRTEEDDDYLRSPQAQRAARAYAAETHVRDFRVPVAGAMCLTVDEQAVIAKASYGRRELPHSRRLRVVSAAEFKPQMDTLDALLDYLASLASSVAEPRMSVGPAMRDVAGRLRSVGGEAASIAGAVGAMPADDAADAKSLMAEKGPIDKYSNAVAGLADAVETYVKEAADVKAIRAKLLAPDDRFVALATEVGRNADAWDVQHRHVIQQMLARSSLAITPELPGMEFQSRVSVIQSLQESAASIAPNRPSPFGAMMGALVRAHAELQETARGHYSPSQRKKLVVGTLSRLVVTMKDVAAVAALV